MESQSSATFLRLRRLRDPQKCSRLMETLMSEESPNDNSGLSTPTLLVEPDAHGQAAMLLSESILHGLIARSIITVPEAIEIVEVAAEVKQEIAEDLGDSKATMRKSLALLSAIRSSLANDVQESNEREPNPT